MQLKFVIRQLVLSCLIVLSINPPLNSDAAPIPAAFQNIIPLPTVIQPANGTFSLTASTTITIQTSALTDIAHYLADRLSPATGYSFPILISSANTANTIQLMLSTNQTLGNEGYQLSIQPNTINLSANTPAGLFHGIQTIRQLLPPTIELNTPQNGRWNVATGTITDTPRFVWRGFMLDVARHFFPVSDVKRLIDLLAYYKLNHLHLHLSDDQGWRIQINRWPNLTNYGGSSQIGAVGGAYFYTQADYSSIVQYASSHFIDIIPEIDFPGHSKAALASYPELSCTGKPIELSTSSISDASSLCISKESTYTFLDNVIAELSALTPGPYLHIGGDEATSTTQADYNIFLNKVQHIASTYHKQLIGWQDIATANLSPAAVLQHWNWNRRSLTINALQQGTLVIMSPVSLGQRYPGYVSIKTSYQWDPVLQLQNATENNILGVEAPLWTEIVATQADLDRMTFPWLISYAEIGWSARKGKDLDSYLSRLATHGPRLTALGVNFYRSPEVSWPH